MFPTFSQRVLIVLGAIVGGLLWMRAVPWVLAADGSTGLSLIDAGSGFAAAALVMLLAGLPAVLLGVVVAALGNPLSGVFAAGTALLFSAVAGGGSAGWLRRIEAPGAYNALIAEVLVWAAAMVGAIALMEAGRRPVRQSLARLASAEPFGSDLGLRLPDGRAIIAGLVCAGIGGAMTTLLLTASDTGQIVGALVLGFAIAAGLTHAIVPQNNLLPLLLSPAIVAIVAYAHVPLRYASQEALLVAWYDGQVWGPALALPIHYLSAGLVGVTVGLGVGQAVEQAREHSAQTA